MIRLALLLSLTLFSSGCFAAHETFDATEPARASLQVDVLTGLVPGVHFQYVELELFRVGEATPIYAGLANADDAETLADGQLRLQFDGVDDLLAGEDYVVRVTVRTRDWGTLHEMPPHRSRITLREDYAIRVRLAPACYDASPLCDTYDAR